MNEYFKEKNKGYESLKKVLSAFSCYDQQVDYVQGMNFIAGQLIVHCNSTVAFWLFVELIEECELRDIFQQNLPGLTKHTYIIRLLVKKHLPKLHEHFEQFNVRPEMYASDWIFSVFTSVLPENETEVTAAFFNLFFQFKWEFFYKLILTILNHIKDKVLQFDDMMSILQQVKIAMSNKNDPYNYAEMYQNQKKEAREKLNVQDSELESVAGSVQRDSMPKEETDDKKPEVVEKEEQTPGGGGGFWGIFGLGKTPDPTPGEPDEEEPWQEFPWKKYLIEEDII